MKKIKTLDLNKKKKLEKEKRLLKTYGLIFETWEEMSKNGCWICGKKDGRICVDHIHVKGFKKMQPEEKLKYIRGALCFMCNTSLKGFEKTINGERNRKQLERTYAYFQVFKLKGEI